MEISNWHIKKLKRILKGQEALLLTKCLFYAFYLINFIPQLNARDSLLLHLENEITAKNIDRVNDGAWDFVTNNLSKFGQYGKASLKASLEIDYLFGQCESFQILGTHQFQSGRLDSALFFYEKALEKRVIYKDSALISGTLNNIANTFKLQGEYFNSLDYYNQAITHLPSNNIKKKARLQDNLSSIHILLGNYAKALDYNQSAIQLLKEQNVDLGTTSFLINQANIYDLMFDHKKAIELYEQGILLYTENGDNLRLAKVLNNKGNVHLKIEEIDKAIAQYQKAIAIYKTIPFPKGLAGTYNNLGIAYKFIGNYELSEKWFNIALSQWTALENDQKQAKLLINLGNLYLDQEQYKKARSCYVKSDSLGPQNLTLQSELYAGFSLTLSKLKLYESAIPLQLKYQKIRDSIENERVKWRNLESEFQLERNKSSLLQKDMALAQEKIKRQNFLRNGLLLGLLLLVGLLYTLYHNFQGQKKRIKIEADAKEKNQKIEKLLKDQELKSIRNVLDMQEKERKRISQDLHDRLGSMLSMVKLHFKNTSEGIENLRLKNEEEYHKANNLLDKACDEVRKIAHNLNSGVLKNFGLVAALEELRTTLINTGKFEVELVTHQLEDRLSLEYETSIYRIIQELIANILNHAHASEISIQLLKKSSSLHITVEDNGQGFDLKKAMKKGGMGLKNIQARLSSIDGKIHTDSHPERGASVFIEIPLKNKL